MDLGEALEIVTRSDTGMVRPHNEDAVYASAVTGIAILADGMGGYNAGEVASGMATTLLSTELKKFLGCREPHAVDGDGRVQAHRTLELGIDNANSAVFRAAQSDLQYAGMGTTLVLALLQEQLDCGMLTEEQARHAQNRNLVTRALGVDASVEAEIHDYEALPGDIYLLCSDGLNDMAEDHEIGATLDLYADDLELAAEQLLLLANSKGGRDNVSVILVRVKRAYGARRHGVARLMDWFKSDRQG
jgi:serine/threonine protein phosphatase PrpC